MVGAEIHPKILDWTAAVSSINEEQKNVVRDKINIDFRLFYNFCIHVETQ
jgi:hypothetical protein